MASIRSVVRSFASSSPARLLDKLAALGAGDEEVENDEPAEKDDPEEDIDAVHA